MVEPRFFVCLKEASRPSYVLNWSFVSVDAIVMEKWWWSRRRVEAEMEVGERELRPCYCIALRWKLSIEGASKHGAMQ